MQSFKVTGSKVKGHWHFKVSKWRIFSKTVTFLCRRIHLKVVRNNTMIISAKFQSHRVLKESKWRIFSASFQNCFNTCTDIKIGKNMQTSSLQVMVDNIIVACTCCPLCHWFFITSSVNIKAETQQNYKYHQFCLLTALFPG